MTVSGTDLKNIAIEARPVVVAGLKVAVQLAAFGKLCRDKGIDWAQLKALLKAEHKDGEDGGDRVEKIIEKADFATAYADMLGISKVNNEIISDDTPGSEPGIAEQPSRADQIRSDLVAQNARCAEVLANRVVRLPTVAVVADQHNPPDAEYDLADIPKGLDRRVSP